MGKGLQHQLPRAASSLYVRVGPALSKKKGERKERCNRFDLQKVRATKVFLLLRRTSSFLRSAVVNNQGRKQASKQKTFEVVVRRAYDGRGGL